jgi:hypothetical protein
MELVGRAPELELLTAVARREGSAGLAARSLLGARPGPVLVAIDDWQWLDAASAGVVTYLARRLRDTSVRMLATVRTGEADAEVAALVRSLPGASSIVRWRRSSRIPMPRCSPRPRRRPPCEATTPAGSTRPWPSRSPAGLS